MSFKNSLTGRRAPSTLKDPFKAENIEKVEIEIRSAYSFEDKDAHVDGMLYSARIKFRNDSTTGYHKLTGAGFDDLVAQIELTIENVKKSG